jgi:hypothetical protein
VEIVAEDLDRMPLLGLFVKAALESRAGAAGRSGLTGAIGLTTGAMSVTLDCSPERIVVRPGTDGDTRAHVRSSLDTLVAIACGRITEPITRRDLRFSGSPGALLALLRVFRSRPDPVERA